MPKNNSGILEQQIDSAKKYISEKKELKAVKLLKRISKSYPLNEKVWLLIGVANHRIGCYNKAIECYKKAANINSISLEAWRLIAVAYMDQGKNTEAEEIIEKAEKLNPSEIKLNFLRSNLEKIYLNYKSFLNRINSSKLEHQF